MIAIDSEFQSLIPPLTDDEYKGLEKSILNEGFHEWEPIVTWNGTIIDGHNRYRICDEHGIKFKQVECEFDNRDSAKIWIIEHQFNRRNLSTYDRSKLALELEPLYRAEAKRRQVASLKQGTEIPVSQKSDERTPLRTDEQLAKLAGTSRDTIRKVKVIETEAEKGNPTAIEAREAVKKGEMSINKAHQSVRPKGDKADTRPLCTVCGKPIDDGDAYSHDRSKHRSCANKVHDQNRTRSKAKYTEDGRRICSICGEPIEEGAHYQDKLNMHYKCGLEHYMDIQRKYRDADHDLRNNTPTYTIESLTNELMSSAESMRDAIAQSIAINESMGVKLSNSQKKRLDRAVTNIFNAIQDIEKESNNG